VEYTCYLKYDNTKISKFGFQEVIVLIVRDRVYKNNVNLFKFDLYALFIFS